jgi:transglutaminase-like putative cysteine protease
MMVRTFIRPDRPIKDPRRARRAVYTLSVPEGKFPGLPPTGFQRVEPAGEQAARVTVGGDPAPAPEEDAKNPAFTASTSMLRWEDPDIKRLTAEALRGAGPDKAARAAALRAFVHRYISTKDLDVGFASASEVARTRRGDCSEHGALLAAMLRADGIPARVACGVIYADQFEGEHGIFGYHMWAQALLEKNGTPTWVDLDATLPSALFDATHIALAVTPLAEGEETTSLAAILPLMGRVAIKVESAE